MKRNYRIALHRMICFLVSVLVVVFCHIRNPYLNFLTSPASYVLFTLAGVSVFSFVQAALRLRASRYRKKREKNLI